MGSIASATLCSSATGSSRSKAFWNSRLAWLRVCPPRAPLWTTTQGASIWEAISNASEASRRLSSKERPSLPVKPPAQCRLEYADILGDDRVRFG